MEFEGSEAGILKFQWNLKVLGVLAGRRREDLQGGATVRLGSNVVENVRFGIPRAPKSWKTYSLANPGLQTYGKRK